jgi:hypothetical protein
MALGEGLVLQAFYAMIETVDEPEITAILKRGVKQEERHVEFGEQQTAKAIQGKPWLKRRLLGLALVSLWGVGRLESFMKSRLDMNHEAIQKLPDLVKFTVRCAETRLMRIGLTDTPLTEMSAAAKLALVIEAYLGKALGGLLSLVLGVVLFPLRIFGVGRPKRLTDTYLEDPLVRGNLIGSQSGDDDDEGATRAPLAAE